MADGVTITEGTGKLISTEDVTTLNGSTVTSQQVQRVATAVVTADGVAKDLKIGRNSDATSLSVALSTEDVAALTPPAAISGFATAANQTTELASLASILAKLSADPSTETTLAAILAKIIAAPATEAKQDALSTLIGEVQASPTSNTLLERLKAIQTALAGSLAVTGTFWQATQPVSAASLPLPTGASTSAKQDTGNTSVASIDTKTPALGQAVAGSSVPVVLPATQITTLTPPAAITGFATETTLSALNGKVPALGQAIAAASVPVILPSATITTLTPPAAISGFATETTLAAQSAKLPAALGQTTKAASLSVTLASNQDALPITDNAGSLTVDGTVAVSGVSGVVDVTPASPAANDYLPVRLTDGSGFVVAGGGQQYAEDAAHVSADLGTMALAVRKDVAAALSGTDGDYAPLEVDASGRLHTATAPLNIAPTVTSVTANNTDMVAAMDVSNYRTATFQLTSIGGGATVQVQVSLDGTTYTALVPNNGAGTTVGLTVIGLYSFVLPPGVLLRIRTTAYTSGTISGALALSSFASQVVSVVESVSNANLRVAISSGAVQAVVASSIDGSTALQQALLTNSRPSLYNGATMDTMRAMVAQVVLASAARTATVSTDVINYNGRTFAICLNITVAPNTASTLTINIRVKDSISGNYVTVLAGAAITGSVVTGAVPVTNRYVVALGVTVVANVSASDALSRTMNVQVVHSNADSWTYSINADIGV